MSKEILLVVDAVSNEKGVEKSVIFEAIEAALASATRKRYGDDIDVRVSINRANGSYETFRRWKVFADDSKELEEPARELRLEDALDIDPKAAAKHLANANAAALRELRDRLASLTDWNAAAIEKLFAEICERHQIALGKLAQPVRVALTGGTASPGIFDVVELVGRETSVARLDHALSLVAQSPAAAAPR